MYSDVLLGCGETTKASIWKEDKNRQEQNNKCFINMMYKTTDN